MQSDAAARSRTCARCCRSRDTEGFEVELQNGVLNLDLRGDRADMKFVVSAERAGAADLGVGDGRKL